MDVRHLISKLLRSFLSLTDNNDDDNDNNDDDNDDDNDNNNNNNNKLFSSTRGLLSRL